MRGMTGTGPQGPLSAAEKQARLHIVEAEMLEAQAKGRDENALRHFGGGSPAYVRSTERAQEYRVQARDLRRRAQHLRTHGTDPGASTGTGTTEKLEAKAWLDQIRAEMRDAR